MIRLGIFDIDYTITKKETLVEFYKFMLRKNPRLLAHLPSTIITGLFYLAGKVELQKAKETFMAFIEGIHEEDMNRIVKEFYNRKLSKIFYSDAIDTVKRLKEEGCTIILISASAEFYLKEFYNIPEVDLVIGTKYKMMGKLHCAVMKGENCKGEEKVKRLMEVIKEKNMEVDFKNSYMFSDSLSDLPLLRLVGNPCLINYKKKYEDIKILKWR